MIKKYAYVVGYEDSSGKWETAYFTSMEQARILYNTLTEKKIKARINPEELELNIKPRTIKAPVFPVRHFLKKPTEVYGRFLTNPHGEKTIVKITECVSFNDEQIYITTLENGEKYYIFYNDNEEKGFFIDDFHELK